jgi:hypothetical protein
MVGLGSFLFLSMAVFSGAFVSGLAGFAFSAVAGGILLHVMEPLEAVSLMMACSYTEYQRTSNGGLFSHLLPLCRFLHWRLCLHDTICLPRFLSTLP